MSTARDESAIIDLLVSADGKDWRSVASPVQSVEVSAPPKNRPRSRLTNCEPLRSIRSSPDSANVRRLNRVVSSVSPSISTVPVRSSRPMWRSRSPLSDRVQKSKSSLPVCSRVDRLAWSRASGSRRSVMPLTRSVLSIQRVSASMRDWLTRPSSVK